MAESRDGFEVDVFRMGQRARVLSDAVQDDESKRLLLEASDTLLFAAKFLRTHEDPSITEKEVLPVPSHLTTVTPRLVIRDGTAAIAFYERCFGAELVGERFDGPNGELIHAEVRVGDSIVMLTEDGADGPIASPDRVGGLVTCLMATYWQNVDEAWRRAIDAGAEVVFPLADQFYGERGGRVRDPFGHQWMLSQHIEDVAPEELGRRAAAYFK